MARQLLSGIKGFMRKYPLVPTTGIYFTLYGAGDITKQLISQQKEVTLVTAGRLGFLGGFVFAPLYHFWFKILDKLFVGNSTKVVLRKLVFDQTIMGAFGTGVFFVGYSILAQKKNIFKDAREKGPKTYAVGCMFWPIVQALNFKFLPCYLRARYVAFCAYLWSIFLATMQSKPVVKLKDQM